jgi:membrane-bound lytic murein transglycosylase A
VIKRVLFGVCLGFGIAFCYPNLTLSASSLRPIEIVNQDNNVGRDEQLWGENGDKQALLNAINHSLSYLNTQAAIRVYANYPVRGITRDRVRRSLLRFRELVLSSNSAIALQEAVQKEFVFYQSVGHDNANSVHFTGYFEPIYSASRRPSAEYRYPLYKKPNNFNQISKLTRAQIEGKDGLLGRKSPVNGQEIVWLKNRMEAFLIHVQGSARLKLTDGTTMTVGYDGHTNHGYVSIGGELVKDGKIERDGLTLPKVIAYFEENSHELNDYLSRNHRFIFFRETKGAPPTGSIGVPVTGDRSIATDKSIMPPGALALIHTAIPNQNLQVKQVSRFVLDQDTGSAIKGAGRVDIFLGTGPVAGDRAGIINGTGQLYYLLLKE